MKNLFGRRASQAGVTLIELMVAVALIGVGILASVSAFSLVHKSIQTSKAGTLAANLAQEQMQIIMQQSYFNILVTTVPYYNTSFTPTVPYDMGYFPPQTILQGGITFTRLTYIQVVQENNGAIQTLPPLTPDTGMRQITVSVIWKAPSGPQVTTIQNVINNPNTVMSNASVQGKVTDSVTGAPIQSALVDVAEDVGWRNTTNAAGQYSINLSPGNFHLTSTALGYFPTNYYIAVAPNSPPQTQNISLTAISTGTIAGSAWLNTHLLISQIVGSSVTAGGFRQAFVELYNPTTFYINIAVSGVPAVLLKWQKRGDAVPTTWTLDYTVANSTVPPNGYYLIANAATVQMDGMVRSADAQFDPSIPNYPEPILINTDPGSDAASLGLSTPGGTWIDQVGWMQGADFPPMYETSPIPNPTGLSDGQQYVRLCSTSGVSNPPIGRAYNDSYNAIDFAAFNPSLFPPRNSGDIEIPIAGIPAVGANVSVTDGVSSSVKTTLVGSPPYAQIIVPGVATGTWTAFVDSGTASAEIDNILVVTNSTTSIPNATTSPTWSVTGVNSVILSTQGVVGIISGYVTDVLNNAITSPAITVSANGQTVTANSLTGHYSVRLPTGTYNVTANPGQANSGYETQTQPATILNIGDETANVNFWLAEGGKLSGWVTGDGINALPGVTVVVDDSNGTARDSEVSDTNGNFTLINLTTGTYTVFPVIDSKETASPTSSTATVSAGFTNFVATFTVGGAMGTVTGNVTSQGNPIQTGVLIIISSNTISIPPPAISSSTLTGAPYYAGSSQENGTYAIEVRGSTTCVYNVVGVYSRLSGSTLISSSQTITNVTVNAGQATLPENFAW